MAIRNLGQIVADAITYIQNKLPGLSMLTGTVARDVVVESPAQEMALIWAELDRIQRQQLMNDATAFTDEELTNLAGTYGIQRLEGVAATGTVTFRLNDFSTSSADIVIPAGTEVSTRAGVLVSRTLSFATTAEKTFVAANADTYFNPATNFFEIDVPVRAEEIGTVGNVGPGTLTVLVTSVAGAPTVTNLNSTSGGAEAEDNDALLSRVLTKVTGTAAGTVDGLTSLINSNPNVSASLIIVPGDPELVRDEFGNAADAVVLGEVLDPVVDTRQYTAGVTTYVLSRQPLGVDNAVDDVIEGVVGGASFSFIKDVHFKVELDTTSLTRGTTSATSRIVFLGSPFPDSGSTFVINYSVNKLIEDLQAAVEADDTKIIGTDILVREAIKVLVRVGAFIKVLPGFTKADVAAEAADNVADLLNASTLDTNIDQSDIIAAIQNTSGVDSVTVPISLEVKRPTDSAFIATSEISIARTEYARPDSSAGAIVIN